MLVQIVKDRNSWQHKKILKLIFHHPNVIINQYINIKLRDGPSQIQQEYQRFDTDRKESTVHRGNQWAIAIEVISSDAKECRCIVTIMIQLVLFILFVVNEIMQLVKAILHTEYVVLALVTVLLIAVDKVIEMHSIMFIK